MSASKVLAEELCSRAEKHGEFSRACGARGLASIETLARAKQFRQLGNKSFT